MWLHIPESCQFAADTAVLTSPSSSFFRELERSATLSGSFPAPGSLRRAWQTGSLTPLRFGQTSVRWTLQESDTGQIGLLAGFHASHTAMHPRHTGEGSPAMSGGSGLIFGESQENAELPQCLSKTPQASKVKDSGTSSEPCPLRGGLRNGQIFERTMLDVRIVGAAFSSSDGTLWPTPTASDWKGQSQPGQRRGTLSEAVEMHNTFTTHYSRQKEDPNYGQPLSEEECRRRLNPDFVDWLMVGIPGWTSLEPIDLERAGMVLCQFKRLVHLCV